MNGEKIAGRSTVDDVVLRIVGLVVMILPPLFMLLVIPSGDEGPAYQADYNRMAISVTASGIMGGLMLIGLGTVVRLLDQIRAQGMAVVGKAELRDSDAQAADAADASGVTKSIRYGPSEIFKKPDGSFSVDNRTFKSEDTAKAYVDFMESRRKG